MSVQETSITLLYRNESWQVHHFGVLYNSTHDILFISDLHLGKAQHFRKHGISVPLQVEIENLNRFRQVIAHFEPSHVYILGDLFHSEHNVQWTVFKLFLDEFPRDFFTLVLGNHDILAYDQYTHPAMQTVDSLIIHEKIILSHYPLDEFADDYLNIAGHIHPAVRIKGQGKQSMRLPVFWFQENQIILPAFGLFTGSHTIRPKKNDLIFGLADAEVFRLQ